jgi:hypothetical protein
MPTELGSSYELVGRGRTRLGRQCVRVVHEQKRSNNEPANLTTSNDGAESGGSRLRPCKQLLLMLLMLLLTTNPKFI